MGEKRPPLLTAHFKLNDVDAIAEAARGTSRHSNVYFFPGVMKRGLDEYQRGTEDDIAAVTGLVLEGDDDNGKPLYLPPEMPAATYIVETSRDRKNATSNQQHHWLFNEPVLVEEAKKLRGLAARVCGGDRNVNKDVVHIFRLPGTWNHPDAKKIGRGRSKEPQEVTLIGGNFKPISFKKLMATLEAVAEAMGIDADEPESVSADWISGGLNDVAEIIKELQGYSKFHELKEWIGEEGDGDRSAHCHKVMQHLMERGLSDDEILVLATAEGSHFADKFVDRPEGELEKEIGRQRDRWVANESKRLSKLEGVEEEGEEDGDESETFFDFVERIDTKKAGQTLSQLRDWILEYSSKPNANMALASAISILSTLAGRHLASPTSCTLNFYVVLLAASGAGKNWPLTAPSIAFEALNLDMLTADSEDFNRLIAASFASAQALENHLMETPAALAAIDEIGNQLLARISSKKASSHEQALGGLLRKLWGIGFADHRSTAAVTRGGSKIIRRPHFGFLGASTEAEFFKAIESGSIDNGFFNRLTIIKADPLRNSAENKLTAKPPRALLERLLDILPGRSGRCLLDPMWNGTPNVVPWANNKAKEIYTTFRDEVACRADSAPELAPYVERTAEQAVRLAAIRAISYDGREAAVTVADMKWGITFAVESAEWAIASVRAHLCENEFQAKVRLIQNTLRKIWDLNTEAARSELYRRIDGRMDPRDIDRVIDLLKVQRFLNEKKLRSGPSGGREKTVYVKAGRREQARHKREK